MVKMTFTLDDRTADRLRQAAARLAKPQSEVVREAIREYADRLGKLTAWGATARIGPLPDAPPNERKPP